MPALSQRLRDWAGQRGWTVEKNRAYGDYAGFTFTAFEGQGFKAFALLAPVWQAAERADLMRFLKEKRRELKLRRVRGQGSFADHQDKRIFSPRHPGETRKRAPRPDRVPGEQGDQRPAVFFLRTSRSGQPGRRRRLCHLDARRLPGTGGGRYGAGAPRICLGTKELRHRHDRRPAGGDGGRDTLGHCPNLPRKDRRYPWLPDRPRRL